ncbi:MAG TPA: hypothetical protein VJ953_04685 [Saprospiraceae bacterium]|nr:hypothetical protein [Saprospiraceae bacterium]
MKILVSPPRNKNLFYHEAQTARKARYIISGLQLLSGATALIGIRLYFSDWLDDMNPVMQYTVMALIAFVLVAPGEMGIRETWAYLFRAVLNRYNTGLNFFSLVLMGIVAIFLTSYSFYLSQHATKSSMQRAAPKVELADTKEISSSFNQEVKRISSDYTTQRDDINQRYRDLIMAENDYYDNMIQSNETEIDQLRRKGWATGQRYTTKINNLEKKNRELETKRAESIKSLKEKQNAELTATEAWKRTAESEAKEEKNATKENIQNRNQEIVEENKAFAQMFSTLIARFAAWSVILVILFTGYLEIFYYKTGIKRVVQFRSTDFQAPVFLELLVFPYVYFSRYLTNFVRSKYDKLPKVVPAPGTEDLVDLDQSAAEEEDQFRPYDFEARFKNQQDKKTEPKKTWFSGPKREVKEDSPEKEFKANNFRTREPEAKTTRQGPPEPDAGSAAKSPEPPFEEPNLFENNDYDFQHRQKDHEPKSQSDAASLSDSLAEIFKRTNENFSETVDRTKLDDISFGQEEVDYSASLKHVDRRTGAVQYLSMDDLEEKLEHLSARMDDASEMYQDTGDPIYLATIEECRNALSYWQTRRVELYQKMHQQTSF